MSAAERAREPLTATTLPFQSRIAYRTDDYSSLRATLVDQLAEGFPQWNRRLGDKQGTQDLAVVLIELFAYMGDILGFYAECHANEAFLRTAVLPQSLIELGALIDYRPAPGASASTLQAFLLKDGLAGVVPQGFKTKTEARNGVPALVFETMRAVAADAARNRLRLAGHDRSLRVLNAAGQPAETSVLLDQGYAGLKAGSFAVFTAPGKGDHPVRLTAVTLESDRTRIAWAPGALPPAVALPVADVQVHGKPRQEMVLAAQARADEITAGVRSAAVQTPSVLVAGDRVLVVSDGVMEAARIIARSGATVTWNRAFPISLRRSATTIHKGVNAGHTDPPIRRGAMKIDRWLLAPTAAGEPDAGDHLLISDAAGVERVTVAGRDGFTIHLADPVPRTFQPVLQGHGHATVELHRVRLPGAPSTPLSPIRLAGTESTLTLARTYEGLGTGALVVLSDGVSTRPNRAALVTIDGEERTVIQLAQPVGAQFDVARLVIAGPLEQAMRVDGHDRSEASMLPAATRITFDGPVTGLKPGDHLVIEGGGHAEGVRISALSVVQGDTAADVEGRLEHAYPLAGTVVYGNVVEATHGETVADQLLGSGDHSQAGQRFALKRQPTTFLHDPEGVRGVASSLEVLVGGERWQEVESLAGSGPDDRHYMVEIDEEQIVTVVFGDGARGARLPTGRDNVRARYRVGLGAAGNVGSGAVSVVPQPLPFVQSSRNPMAAAGGADRETPEETRRIAPITVRTLDRAVSLPDYADLALAYPGVAKARADWEWERGRRIVLLTVAAAGGVPLSPGLKDSLTAYLDARRPPRHRLRLRDARTWPVRLALEVTVLPDFLRAETRRRVEEALGAGLTEAGARGYYNFDRLALGQDLYLSDVYAIVEGVRGVDHVRATAFHPEAAPAAVLDTVRVPADALATGGDPASPAIGVLAVKATGGLV
ncbi:MAG: putative baseplate assembly protein [Candidatus Rokuibacteriota bacterium]